jgi:hypothetical protein
MFVNVAAQHRSIHSCGWSASVRQLHQLLLSLLHPYQHVHRAVVCPDAAVLGWSGVWRGLLPAVVCHHLVLAEASGSVCDSPFFDAYCILFVFIVLMFHFPTGKRFLHQQQWARCANTTRECWYAPDVINTVIDRAYMLFSHALSHFAGVCRVHWVLWWLCY